MRDQTTPEGVREPRSPGSPRDDALRDGFGGVVPNGFRQVALGRSAERDALKAFDRNAEIGSRAEQETPERSQSRVHEFLAEYREKVADGSLLKGSEEVVQSTGVDDIFREFFRMEAAARSETRGLGPSDSAPQGDESRGDKAELYHAAQDYVLSSIRAVKEGRAPDVGLGAGIVERMVLSLSQGDS